MSDNKILFGSFNMGKDNGTNLFGNFGSDLFGNKNNDQPSGNIFNSMFKQ